MANLCKVYKCVTAWTAAVRLQNKGERQFFVPVWSHSSRNSTTPAKTSSWAQSPGKLVRFAFFQSEKKGLHCSGLQKNPHPQKWHHSSYLLNTCAPWSLSTGAGRCFPSWNKLETHDHPCVTLTHQSFGKSCSNKSHRPTPVVITLLPLTPVCHYSHILQLILEEAPGSTEDPWDGRSCSGGLGTSHREAVCRSGSQPLLIYRCLRVFPWKCKHLHTKFKPPAVQLPCRLLKCCPRAVRWRPVLERDPHAEPSRRAVTSDLFSYLFAGEVHSALFTL